MKIDVTRDEVIEILAQQVLVQDSRDSEIRNGILDKYENEDYYDDLLEVYHEISMAYFKLGADMVYLIKD